MKIKDLSTEERPRERLLSKGAGNLTNSELLAILLRTGTGKYNVIEMSRALLRSAEDSLVTLSAMSPERMMEISGIGKDKAVTIAAVMELGRRFNEENSFKSNVSITGPEMIYRIMASGMKGKDHEECWVIYLNRANHIISKEMLSSGGMTSTIIDIQMILRRILEKKASGIILVHNHPSGNSRPGRSDIQQTENLKKALEHFNVSLIDHLIICDEQYYSFADNSVTISEND